MGWEATCAVRRQCSVVALPTADRKAELRVVVSRIFKIRQQLQAAIIVRCPTFREQRRACTGWGCEFDRTALVLLPCACVVAQEAAVPGEWSHITKQIGMFCFTGLTGAWV